MAVNIVPARSWMHESRTIGAAAIPMLKRQVECNYRSTEAVKILYAMGVAY